MIKIYSIENNKIIIIFFYIQAEKILNSSSMYRLYQGLFNGYNNKIRPVIDNNHITFVNITLVLLNLVGMVRLIKC